MSYSPQQLRDIITGFVSKYEELKNCSEKELIEKGDIKIKKREIKIRSKKTKRPKKEVSLEQRFGDMNLEEDDELLDIHNDVKIFIFFSFLELSLGKFSLGKQP